MTGLIEKSAPALLAGFFTAALLPADDSALALVLAPLLVLVGRRLVAPTRGAAGLAFGTLLAQCGALALISGMTQEPALDQPIAGSFAARSGSAFARSVGGGARLQLEDLRLAEKDDEVEVSFAARAVVDTETSASRTLPGLPLRLEGRLEPQGDRPWRFQGLMVEDREALAPADHAGRLRRDLAGRLTKNVGVEARPWLAALVLGLRIEDPELRDVLARSGAGHFFVVSGLHVGLLAGLLFRLAAWFGLDRRRSGLIVLPFAFFYALVSGGRPPVMRAFALLAFLVVADLAGRPTRPFRLLLTISALALMAAPELLRDASFTYSFAAVAGIVAFGLEGRSEERPLERFLSRKRSGRISRSLRATLRMSAAAFLATAPLGLLGQGYCAPASIVASLLLLPLVMLLLLLAGLALVVALPTPPLAALIDLMLTLLRALSVLPGGRIETGPAPIGAAILGWAALGAAALLDRRRRPRLETQGLAWSGFGAMLVWAALSSGTARFEPQPGERSLLVRGAGEVIRMSTEARDGRLDLERRRHEDGDLDLARVNGVVTAVRIEERGETTLVVGADVPRLFDLPWGDAALIVFARPCSAVDAGALVQRFRAERYRALARLDPEVRRVLAGAGIREELEAPP